VFFTDLGYTWLYTRDLILSTELEELTFAAVPLRRSVSFDCISSIVETDNEFTDIRNLKCVSELRKFILIYRYPYRGLFKSTIMVL